MSLVLELQKDLISNEVEITTILRKALLISKKLSIKESIQWLEYEINGYPNSSVDLFPEYRNLSCNPKALNPHYGWQPLIFNDENNLDMLKKTQITWSIAEIENNLKNSEDIIYLVGGRANILAKHFNTQVHFEISTASLHNILEQVRIKLLNWTTELEEKGILGKGISFSQEEKISAQNFHNCIFDNSVKNSGALGANIDFNNSGNIGHSNNITNNVTNAIDNLIKEIQSDSNLKTEVKDGIIENLNSLKIEKEDSKIKKTFKTLIGFGTILFDKAPYITERIDTIKKFFNL
ncbi:MAG: hypothetical protein ACRDAG_10110 [Cetobacterium somerae]|uniref:AbiTii domain-containing protein n=1 Tax=Cetobacterium somerae TaxID=188913 RepID=UPI003F30A99F